MRELKIEVAIDLSKADEVAALEALTQTIAANAQAEVTNQPATEPEPTAKEAEEAAATVDPEEDKKLKAREASKRSREKAAAKKAAEDNKKAEEEAAAAEQETEDDESGSSEINRDTLREMVSKKVTDTPSRQALKAKLTELGANNITQLEEKHFDSLFDFLSDL